MIDYISVPAMSPPSKDFADQLEAAKRASVAQLLFRCARLLNEQAIARVRERFGVPVRPSHMSLFPHLDLEGTRLSVLTQRLGISKQAVGQLVGDLEDFGVLERMPDPDDGRAKRVCLTEEGRAWMFEGLAILGQLEGEMSQQLGDRRMRALHGTLLDLLDRLEGEPNADPS